MNVLFVHGSHTVKGGDTVYLHQVTELAPSFGFNCVLLSIEKQETGYSVQILHEKKQLPKKNIAEVKAFIDDTCRSFDIDIIHVHTIYMPAITEHCLKMRPVFKTPHSTDLICPGAYKFYTSTQNTCTVPFGIHCIRDAYTKRCCSRNPLNLAALYHNVRSEINRFSRQYQKIIVMSEYIKQECIRAGIEADKVEVNHYFTPEAPPAATSHDGVRKILFLGRIAVIKGLPYLLNAMAPILKERKDVELHIAGSGSQEPAIKKLAEELNIQSSVIFHGWQSRESIGQLLRDCYLLAVPSIYPEAFGIVGIEAMMYGKPVVGFDSGGISSWLKNGHTGVLVPNKDSGALRAGIESIINNDELYDSMALNAHRDAMEHFTPRVHFQKLILAYEACINLKGNSKLISRT
jgi:glycosyltransferase involved in cell wall biosynthesis